MPDGQIMETGKITAYRVMLPDGSIISAKILL
jgi:hypothetical protein